MINFNLLESTANAQQGTNSMWTMLIVWAIIIVGLWLILFRPQSKKRKQEEALRNNMQIGDDITTIGGIVGKVVAIKEETDSIVVETGSDRVRLNMKRWAVASVDTVHPEDNVKDNKKESKNSDKKENKKSDKELDKVD